MRVLATTILLLSLVLSGCKSAPPPARWLPAAAYIKRGVVVYIGKEDDAKPIGRIVEIGVPHQDVPGATPYTAILFRRDSDQRDVYLSKSLVEAGGIYYVRSDDPALLSSP